jgi:hypothetical protein
MCRALVSASLRLFVEAEASASSTKIFCAAAPSNFLIAFLRIAFTPFRRYGNSQVSGSLGPDRIQHAFRKASELIPLRRENGKVGPEREIFGRRFGVCQQPVVTTLGSILGVRFLSP